MKCMIRIIDTTEIEQIKLWKKRKIENENNTFSA